MGSSAPIGQIIGPISGSYLPDLGLSKFKSDLFRIAELAGAQTLVF